MPCFFLFVRAIPNCIFCVSCEFSVLPVGRLKTETGTLITIPPDDSNSDTIRIEGSPEGVKQAKAALVEMAEKMVSGGLLHRKCSN